MEKIRDFSKNSGVLIQFFLILAILFTGINFLLPKGKELFQMNKTIKAKKEKLAKLTQKVAFLESLDEYEITNKTQFLLKVLPPEEDIFIPLSALKGLASQFYDIQIKDFKIDLGREEVKNQLSSISFSLKIVGSKESIINFIDKIKATYPLMRVDEISIFLSEEELPASLLKIEAFFLSLPKEMGKTEEFLSLITSAEEKVYREISTFSFPLKEEVAPTLPSGKENPFTF